MIRKPKLISDNCMNCKMFMTIQVKDHSEGWCNDLHESRDYFEEMCYEMRNRLTFEKDVLEYIQAVDNMLTDKWYIKRCVQELIRSEDIFGLMY